MDLLIAGRAADALRLLEPVVAEVSWFADAHRLLGLALRDTGELERAETALRTALRLDPSSGPPAVALSELLLTAGRAEAAREVVAPLAARADADINVLTALAAAERALGDIDAALASYRRAIQADPSSGVAEHNLAALLGDLQRFKEAEDATGAAFAKGLDAPETWLIRARALAGQGRHEEAETAYRETVRRRSDYVGAHTELAQLVWMRTENIAAALSVLDLAIAAHPQLQALRAGRAELLEYAGDVAGAYDAIADLADRPDAEPMIHVLASRLLAPSDQPRARAHALRAAEQTPGHPVALGNLCEAYFAGGEIEAAAAVAAELRRQAPLNQHALGLQATAWRLMGDPRAAQLHDYPRLVRASAIDTPDGWPTLDAFLGDLTASLARLHTLRTHPVGQSVRHGSQTSQSLTLSEDPVILAFFRAVDGPIRRYLAALGGGEDVVRSRNTGGYRFNGAWSVRLRPDGYHADHLHPMGWLSSAFYVALPGAVQRGREGWLKFGEPGVRTDPPLPPEYFVKPEPGLLVLFPSYMWHGTIPFSGPDTRLTIAFDLLPA